MNGNAQKKKFKKVESANSYEPLKHASYRLSCDLWYNCSMYVVDSFDSVGYVKCSENEFSVFGAYYRSGTLQLAVL